MHKNTLHGTVILVCINVNLEKVTNIQMNKGEKWISVGITLVLVNGDVYNSYIIKRVAME